MTWHRLGSVGWTLFWPWPWLAIALYSITLWMTNSTSSTQLSVAYDALTLQIGPTGGSPFNVWPCWSSQSSCSLAKYSITSIIIISIHQHLQWCYGKSGKKCKIGICRHFYEKKYLVCMILYILDLDILILSTTFQIFIISFPYSALSLVSA